MTAAPLFTRMAEHAPEPGLGGAAYDVHIPVPTSFRRYWVGRVRSRWDRTNGVHWTAADREGDVIVSGRAARAFETRAAAAAALVAIATTEES